MTDNSQTTREEILEDLRRSVVVAKDNEGDYHVSLGDGVIEFVIYQNIKGDPDVKAN